MVVCCLTRRQCNYQLQAARPRARNNYPPRSVLMVFRHENVATFLKLFMLFMHFATSRPHGKSKWRQLCRDCSSLPTGHGWMLAEKHEQMRTISHPVMQMFTPAPSPLGSLSRSSPTPIEHVSPCATSPLGIACSHPPTHLERGHELAQIVSTSAGREFTQPLVLIREWRPIPRRFLTEWSPQARETRVSP